MPNTALADLLICSFSHLLISPGSSEGGVAMKQQANEPMSK
jgi:hypothetical protein